MDLCFAVSFWKQNTCFLFGDQNIFHKSSVYWLSYRDTGYLTFFFYHSSSLSNPAIKLQCLYFSHELRLLVKLQGHRLFDFLLLSSFQLIKPSNWAAMFIYWPIGSGPRYMNCVTFICMLRESKNLQPCENHVQLLHGHRFFDSSNVQKHASKSDTLALTIELQCLFV